MRKGFSKEKRISYIRNFIFGVQDSFGSTGGFLSGIAIGGVDQKTLLLSGTVLIFVEAFSMAVGSLLSEHTVREYKLRKSLPLKNSIVGPIIMFFSYALTGFIPLMPYILFWGPYSLILSISISLLVLLIVGILSAKLFQINILHHTKEMLLIGGPAILIGVLVGKLFPY